MGRQSTKEGKVIMAKMGHALLLVGLFELALGPVMVVYGQILAVFVCGVSLVASGPVLLAIYGYRLIARYHLVIGKSYLQLRKFGSRVVGQIPLDNVQSSKIDQRAFRESAPEEDERHIVLGILLIHRKRTDTWWPKMDKDREFDVVLEDEYVLPLSKIRRLLEEKAEAFRKQE